MSPSLYFLFNFNFFFRCCSNLRHTLNFQDFRNIIVVDEELIIIKRVKLLFN